MAVSVSMIGLAALAGFMGAPHCLAMCGGIVTSLSLGIEGTPLRSALAYNAGRVMTYAAIGGVMGTAGSFLDAAGRWTGIQGAAGIIGGILMLLWALRKTVLPVFPLRLPAHSALQAKLVRLGLRREGLIAFLMGLLFGFLPCGLTYAMQMNAAASGSGTGGALLMLAFGLATFPAMLLAAHSAGTLAKRWRRAKRRAGTALACLMGALSILKGLSANGVIPAVHPWLW